MIHPHTQLKYISKEIGYGVVATQLIHKGTITWAFDLFDQSFTLHQVEAMDKGYKDILDKYSYRDQNGNHILCWDHSRFVNHSFNSNCISTPYNFELAVRDINKGEELTDDYGYLNCKEPFECVPEPHTLRTSVMPDDLLHFYKEWDYKLLYAFERLNCVEQPLRHLIESQYKDKVNRIANNNEEMDSILHSFFSEDEVLMAKKNALLRCYSSCKMMESLML